MITEKILLSVTGLLLAIALYISTAPEEWKAKLFVSMPFAILSFLLAFLFVAWVLFRFADVPIRWLDKFFRDN